MLVMAAPGATLLVTLRVAPQAVDRIAAVCRTLTANIRICFLLPQRTEEESMSGTGFSANRISVRRVLRMNWHIMAQRRQQIGRARPVPQNQLTRSGCAERGITLQRRAAGEKHGRGEDDDRRQYSHDVAPLYQEEEASTMPRDHLNHASRPASNSVNRRASVQRRCRAASHTPGGASSHRRAARAYRWDA